MRNLAIIIIFAAVTGIYSRAFSQNLVPDGGFEYGDTSSFWFYGPDIQVADSNWVTPHSGGYCAIFQGYWAQPGAGYFDDIFNTSGIMIPSASFAEFSVYINHLLCGSPNDSITIYIDYTPIFTILATDPFLGDSTYHLYAADISQFADGNYHMLNVHMYWEGFPAGITECLFDDFSITTNATSNTNVIKGKIFVDSDLDGNPDPGEQLLSNLAVTEVSNSATMFSNSNGNYYFPISDTGNFILTAPVFSNFNCIPQTITKYFNSFGNVDSNNHFGYQPVGTINDLKITIAPTTPFRPGRNASYLIHYSNVGTTVMNPEIRIYPGNFLSYASSTLAPIQITNDSISWSPGMLNPLSSGQFVLTVHVDSTAVSGTIINCPSVILPVTGDANATDNYNNWEVVIVASSDPNDIAVNPVTLNSNEFPNPPYLNYIIRFQNTGNDTAFTVRIENTIEQFLDETTFEFIGASHPVQISYNVLLRTYQFLFENILLADSNVNEAASHGFIQYRIKPVNSLVAGDSVQNAVSIFFDYNVPVVTNTAVTYIVNPNLVASVQSNSFINFYPNPASDIIYISTSRYSDEEFTLEIYNATGLLVSKRNIGNLQNENNVSLRDLNSGTYFMKLISEHSCEVKKIVRL